MKTSELTGAALDWAVVRANYEINFQTVWNNFSSECHYSTDWAQGGPLIERERISVWFERHDDVDSGLPIWFAQDGYAPVMQGPTPLIAAMRCYVAGQLGDEVEIPAEWCV